MWKKHFILAFLYFFLIFNLTSCGSPSINLYWTVDEPVHAFAVQVTVTEEYDNTYWCTVGWHSGYCGLQSISDSHLFFNNKYKMVLFSIWNKGNNNPKFVDKDPEVYETTFGGEGEGLSYRADTTRNKLADWQVGKKYIYLVRSYPANGGSNIDLYLNKPEYGNQFRYFATFFENSSTPGKLTGLFSFIEDFTGNNGKRSGLYKAFMKKELGGTWEAVKHVYAATQPGFHVIKVVSDDEGQAISITSGGSDNIGSGDFDYDPGKLPDPLAAFPY